jgi:CRP/FNR family transcriptional regulator, anaerobic regulatory protein
MNSATVEAVRGTQAFSKPSARHAALLSLSIVPVPKRPAHAVSCSSCCLKGVCLPCGLDIDKLDEMDELTRVKRRVSKGSGLYRSGDAFESLYAVRSGSFKSVGISRAGDEKVTGLHLPGDVMGLEAINSRKHTFDAVALEDSEVCIISFARLTELALRVPQLQAQLLRVLSSDISRDQGLMLLMGGMDAEQRIAAFLLSLARRYEKLGYASTRFNLRMTREDIGSYLGLTLETVSRVFSRLQRDGLIAARQKDIELKDLATLRERVGNW